MLWYNSIAAGDGGHRRRYAVVRKRKSHPHYTRGWDCVYGLIVMALNDRYPLHVEKTKIG